MMKEDTRDANLSYDCDRHRSHLGTDQEVGLRGPLPIIRPLIGFDAEREPVRR